MLSHRPLAPTRRQFLLSGVRQTGSLESGEIYVDVLMENDGRRLHAGLLVDTGCNLPLNISDYKADQLGLPLNGDCARLEMAQGNMGVVQRRWGTAVQLQLQLLPVGSHQWVKTIRVDATTVRTIVHCPQYNLKLQFTCPFTCPCLLTCCVVNSGALC